MAWTHSRTAQLWVEEWGHSSANSSLVEGHSQGAKSPVLSGLPPTPTQTTLPLQSENEAALCVHENHLQAASRAGPGRLGGAQTADDTK